MRLQAPCKDCKERHIGCRSECERYIEFNNESKKIWDDRARKSEEKYQMAKQIGESKKRMKRGKG